MIDVHVHLYPPEIRDDQEAISAREPYFDLLTHNRVHKWGTAEELIDRMDAEGVDQCWAFGFAFRDLGLCRVCNDYLIDAARRYPGRIKAFAVVPPLSSGAVAEVERCADAGCVGLGELFPQGQGFALDDSSHTAPLAGVAAERGLIFNIHTAEPTGHDYAGKGNVGPREAAAFCEHHPDVKVVFAHFGGGLWLYETMPEVRKTLRNARYDTAAWPYLYNGAVLKAAWAAGIGEKLLFGTDWPILTSHRFESRLEAAGLDDGQRKAFLGGNAHAFLTTPADVEVSP